MMDAQHIDASPVLDIGVLDRLGGAAEKSQLFHEEKS
jgi:hypothetical protein